MLMKQFLFLAAAVMLAASVQAQKTLDIKFADDTHHEILLQDNPQMVNDGTQWVVTATGFEATYAYSDVAELTILDTPTDIEMVEGNAEFSYQNKVLTVSAVPGTKVIVATMGGAVVRTVTVPADGTASVDMSTLPQGAYIVTTNKKSFKILN